MRTPLLLVLTLIALVLLPASASAQSSDNVRIVETAAPFPQIAASPDSRLVAAWSDGAIMDWELTDPSVLTIELFQIDSGTLLGTLEGAGDYTTSARFSPDSAQLITLHMNGELNVWDVASLQRISSVKLPVLGGRIVGTFEDGRLLVLNEGIPTTYLILRVDGTVEGLLGEGVSTYAEWVAASSEISLRGAYQHAVAALSPDNTRLAIADYNGNVRVNQLGMDEWITVRRQADPDRPMMLDIRRLHFTPTGELVFFDPAEAQTFQLNFERPLDIGAFPFGGQHFALTSDGSHIAYLVNGEPAIYWAALEDDAQPEVIATLDVPSRGRPVIEVTADSAYLLVGALEVPTPGQPGKIYIVDLNP